jgi:3-methyladenine DNA glycosylase AlkD
MSKIIEQMRNELKASASERVKNVAQRFFKEKVKVHGVKAPIIRKISKKCFSEIKNLSKKEIFILCEELFKSGFGEQGIIAGIWIIFTKDSCRAISKSLNAGLINMSITGQRVIIYAITP